MNFFILKNIKPLARYKLRSYVLLKKDKSKFLNEKKNKKFEILYLIFSL